MKIMRVRAEQEPIIEQRCPDYGAGCDFLAAVDSFKPFEGVLLFCGAVECPLMNQLKEVQRTSTV
jgi:hypothetical protein